MKVTGPAFSLAASGTIGGMITASRWKGRAYFRTRVTPHNPRSEGQTAQRAMFKYLSQNWGLIGDGDRATYNGLAAASNVSEFNAYQKFNMDRWTHVLAPSVAYPAAELGAPDAPGAAIATAGVKQITATTTNSSFANSYGAVLFAKKGSAPTGVKSEVKAVLYLVDGNPATFVHTGLTPGDVWHYKWRVFTDSGKYGTLGADGSATVL